MTIWFERKDTQLIGLQTSQTVVADLDIDRTDLHERAMPKQRPMRALKGIGQQIRARRVYLGRTRKNVARVAGISATMLGRYEAGQSHAPVHTLLRISAALDVSTSELLGETTTENAKQVEQMMQIWAHPVVGDVVRSMCEMRNSDRMTLKIIATAFAARNAASVDRASPNQTNSSG
jgi:transcriptional regulator with XRE-family HTH domain